MVLLTTIQRKLEKIHGSLYPDFDVRYLSKWITLYPRCFRPFIIKGNYEAKIIWNKTYSNFRWEIHKLKL